MATRSRWHFNRCTPPHTPTKSKHPSSQTEEICVEMEFGSYKALFRACKLAQNEVTAATTCPEAPADIGATLADRDA
eukprot:scaffold15093_cov72-Skeletonema_marinoi.AAC.1